MYSIKYNTQVEYCYLRFFLVENNVDVNSLNRSGESALHLACQMGMASLTRKLLESGCDPNLQTPPPSNHCVTSTPNPVDSSNPFDDDDPAPETTTGGEIGLLSPLHFAVNGGFEEIILTFVEQAQ